MISEIINMKINSLAYEPAPTSSSTFAPPMDAEAELSHSYNFWTQIYMLYMVKLSHSWLNVTL